MRKGIGPGHDRRKARATAHRPKLRRPKEREEKRQAEDKEKAKSVLGRMERFSAAPKTMMIPKRMGIPHKIRVSHQCF